MVEKIGDNSSWEVGSIASYNDGTIKNCKNYSDFPLNWTNIGGIAAYNCQNAEIIDCANFGNLGTKEDYIEGEFLIGGISEKSIGTIKNCYNTGNLINYGNRIYIGGIIGAGGINAENFIISCYNTGSIEAMATYCPRIGGLVGAGEYTTITDSYNAGDINVVSPSKYTKIGGIIGETMYGTNTVINCYNVGELTGVGSGYVKKGGIIGNGSNNPVITSAYYKYVSGLKLNYDGKPTVTTSSSKTEEEMKTSDFLNLINSNSKFKLDTELINNGYPILIWQ